jgi:hypothetical protein
VSELEIIRTYLLQGGPRNFAEGLMWHQLRTAYPDDARRIQAELKGQGIAPAAAQPVDELAARRLRRRRI